MFWISAIALGVFTHWLEPALQDGRGFADDKELSRFWQGPAETDGLLF